MIGIGIKLFLALAFIFCINVGWGICKLSNVEADKDKKGTLGLGMLLCFVLGGLALYKLILL
jgi:hypothetical protein